MGTHPAARAAARFYAASRAMEATSWAELFAEGAVVEDPVGSPTQVGPTAIRAFFAGILERFQSFGLTEDHVFVAGDTAAVKWTARGLTLGGRPVAFEGIDILTVDAEGKILSLRAYWEPAPFFAILAAEDSASF